MRKIPLKMRTEMSLDPYYKTCARENDECSGRITWEHAFIYAGRQVNEKWAIIPLCVYHHLGPGLDKDLNRFIALRRANDEELLKYPSNWDQLKSYLDKKYA